MGMLYDGTNKTHTRTDGPTDTDQYFVSFWGRWDTKGNFDTFYYFTDGSNWHEIVLDSTGDQLLSFDHREDGAVTGRTANFNPTAATWYHMGVQRSPGVANDDATLRYRPLGNDNYTELQVNNNDLVTPFSMTINSFRMGRNRSSGGCACSVAGFKVWDGKSIWSDAQLLTESKYRNPQIEGASIWCAWHGKSDALEADSSGNNKPLTANNAPTFTADPSEILGDDPAIESFAKVLIKPASEAP